MHKHYVFTVIALGVLSGVFFSYSAEAQVACPYGYVCTPISQTSPSNSSIPSGMFSNGYYYDRGTIGADQSSRYSYPTSVTPTAQQGTVASSPSSSCYVFNRPVGPGTSNQDVAYLQTFLINRGFDIPSITRGYTARGYFGFQTAQALMSYQQSSGLQTTGILDTATRARINASCSQTTTPPPVTQPPTTNPPSSGNICPADVMMCSDGSYVSRDPSQSCQFRSCPTSTQQPAAPTISSFNVSPASVYLGQYTNWSGYALMGSIGIKQYRAYIVGSNNNTGSAWTPANGSQSVSFNTSVLAEQNSRSFYNGVGSYTARFEVEDLNGAQSHLDRPVTMLSSYSVPPISNPTTPTNPTKPTVGSPEIIVSYIQSATGSQLDNSSQYETVPSGDQLVWVAYASTKNGATVRRYRAYIVGSSGGNWTYAQAGQTTVSMSTFGLYAAQNSANFYNGVGTYTARFEIEDSNGLVSTKDWTINIVAQ